MGRITLPRVAVTVAGLLLVASIAAVPTEQASAGENERVRCDGRVATIVGTPRAERIMGTSGDDVIAALGGRDTVEGRGGDDVLCGGDGSDTLEGGRGADRLLGGLDGTSPDSHCDLGRSITGDRLLTGRGDDYVDPGYDPRQTTYCFAQHDRVSFRDSRTGIRATLGDPGKPGVVRSGRDRDVVRGQLLVEVQGSRHDDRILGGAGEEVLHGNGGVDEIAGGDGADQVFDDDYRPGEAAGDRLVGGPGDDILTSWRGPDEVTGADDDDVLNTDFSCSTMAGGSGHDQVGLWARNLPDGTVRVAFDAAAGTVTALPAQPACGRFSELESYLVVPTSFPMDFVGTDAAEELLAYGTAGVTASMGSGDDVVRGTDADDVIDAGAGLDAVDGALGRDVCIGAESATSCDADTLPLPPPSCDGRLATIVAASRGGALAGTPGDDVIVGSDFDDQIDGLGGNDVICGRVGADRIRGGEGGDRIFAGEDYEYPEGGFIGDFVLPGPGDDVVDLGADPRRAEGQGRDTLSYAESATGIIAELAAPGGTFTVSGEGTDTVTTHQPFQLWGSDQADVLTGSPGDDRIQGMGGDDVINGGAGDDELRGEDDCSFAGCRVPDHDVLVGGDGDDALGSGAGRDDLDGGPGDDFVSASSRLGVGTLSGGAGADTLHVYLQTADMQGHVDGGPDTDLLRVIAFQPLEPGTRVVVDAALGLLRARGLGELITFAGIESYDLNASNTNSNTGLAAAAPGSAVMLRLPFVQLHMLGVGSEELAHRARGPDLAGEREVHRGLPAEEQQRGRERSRERRPSASDRAPYAEARPSSSASGADSGRVAMRQRAPHARDELRARALARRRRARRALRRDERAPEDRREESRFHP